MIKKVWRLLPYTIYGEAVPLKEESENLCSQILIRKVAENSPKLEISEQYQI